MTLSRDQAHRLVAHALDCRPNGAPRWDPPGILSALEKVRHLAYAEVALAVTRAACDKDARTPAVIAATNSQHWRERVTPTMAAFPAKAGTDCRIHPGKDALACTACAADRLAGDRPHDRPSDGTPPADWAQRTRALIANTEET